MSKRALAVVALFAVTATLIAAGCGGSSRNKAYASSKADFAAAMNSICAAVNAKDRAIGKPQSIQDIAKNGDALRKVGQNAIKTLKKLEPPAEIKTQVEHFITVKDQEDSKIGDLIAAVKKGDTAKITQLTPDLTALDKSTDADANAIGAPACLSTSS
jgi:hypothetical protein